VNSGTYAGSTVTQSDIVNIGLGSNESTIIGQNYCGASANASSCLLRYSKWIGVVQPQRNGNADSHSKLD